MINFVTQAQHKSLVGTRMICKRVAFGRNKNDSEQEFGLGVCRSVDISGFSAPLCVLWRSPEEARGEF